MITSTLLIAIKKMSNFLLRKFVTVKQIGHRDFTKSWCANLLFCILFAENCMKMKEFGPQGGFPDNPLDPPLITLYQNTSLPVV